jgi:predicted membrane protein (TIGR00267 family)
MEKEEVVRIVKENLEEGERWHKRVNVREIVFGLNDGSISTLALLAAVTGASLAKNQILMVGISGVIAGAISMAIGSNISSKSEIEHHQSEIKREKREIEEVPDIEREEIRQLYQKKADFTEKELNLIVNRITSNKEYWLDSMMKEELGLFEERFENPLKLGLIMLTAFIVGGFIPLLPFFIFSHLQTSFITASIMTFLSLFIIGIWKTTFTEKNWLLSGMEMIFVGALAAVIPYIIGDLILPSTLSWILS